MFSTVSPPKEPSAPKPRELKPFRDLGAAFAVIEIEISSDSYKPKAPDSCPSEDLAGVPVDLVTDFAKRFNASRHARNLAKWACVGVYGSMFYLRGVTIANRPEDPGAFPPGSKGGLTMDEAIAAAEADNIERLKHTNIPKRWTVALRPLLVTEGMVSV